MNKQYILSGDPKELDKVIRENRIRINRGVISITPVEPETADDLGNIADENVPDMPENVPDMPENVPAEPDDKPIEIEDMKEVDLDPDDKTVVADDSKDVPETDVKEAEAEKTSKRNKKPE